MTWESRIIGHGVMDPHELIPNPKNWRTHPKLQEKALEGALEDIGWIQDVIVNERTGKLLDGHLRVELAKKRGEHKIPVVMVDLSEEEEELALITLDPITAMAEADKDMLNDLIERCKTDNQKVKDLLQNIAEKEKLNKIIPHALSDTFIIPPFSILDTRQKYWQERKRQWIDLGISSELGRVDGALKFSDTVRIPRGGIKKEDYNSTSVFDPVLCEIVYKWFSAPNASIIDPFAGGSVRGIVASKLDRKYTGIDLSSKQIEENIIQAEKICESNIPQWIIGDSADIEIKENNYDLLFTCPPYFNLERYSDDERDLSNMNYPEFKKKYENIIKKYCALLNDNRFAAILVSEVRDKNSGRYLNFVSDTISAFINAGLAYYNEGILISPVGSLQLRVGRYFPQSRKLGKTHQNLLVFIKGNPEKATKYCGDIEVSFPEVVDGVGT